MRWWGIGDTSKLYHKIEFYLGDANLMILKWNCGILTTQGKKKRVEREKKKNSTCNSCQKPPPG